MKTSRLLVALALAAIPAFAQSRPVLAEGTEIKVRTDQNIPAKPPLGSAYSATVSEDVLGRSGAVIIPRGSPARLVAVQSEGGKDVVLDLRSVTVNKRRYLLAADTRKSGGAGVGANTGLLSTLAAELQSEPCSARLPGAARERQSAHCWVGRVAPALKYTRAGRKKSQPKPS